VAMKYLVETWNIGGILNTVKVPNVSEAIRQVFREHGKDVPTGRAVDELARKGLNASPSLIAAQRKRLKAAG
jgi:hypothetical protein